MPASRKHRTVVAAALGTLLILASVSVLAADDRNTTGLPTYPHISRAIMDPVPRDTLGSKCIHYTADSPTVWTASRPGIGALCPGLSRAMSTRTLSTGISSSSTASG
jgi:hypothetical protein